MGKGVGIVLLIMGVLVGAWHLLYAQSYRLGPLSLSDCTTTGQALQWNNTTRLFQCTALSVVPSGYGIISLNGSCAAGFTVNNTLLSLLGVTVCVKN